MAVYSPAASPAIGRRLVSLATALLLLSLAPVKARGASGQHGDVPSQAAGGVAVAAPTGADGLSTFDAAWTAIRDTYVDESRSDADWEALRAEFRPRAARATSSEQVRDVLRELLARIGHSHFDLLSSNVRARLDKAAANPSEVGTIGADLTPIDGELVIARVDPSSPALEAGLRPGSVIEAIDDVELRDAAGTMRSADFERWATAQSLLRGRTGTQTSLRVRELDGRTSTRKVPRAREQGQPVTLGHLPTFFARLDRLVRDAGNGRHVAVVRFNVWMVPLAPEIDRAVDDSRGADGIVIDLRGNPGGVLSMLMGVSGHFLDAPVRLGTLRTRDSELNLIANPRTVAPDGRKVAPYDGPLAILVDQTSYSASEIFAAGMQSVGRARVFGQKTPGGALPAMLRELPSGDVLEYAIGDFVTATGQRIEGNGVVPDETVAPSRAALAAGRDEVLDAAIAWAAAGPVHPKGE
jgi:carboxyl-terminal processing protease